MFGSTARIFRRSGGAFWERCLSFCCMRLAAKQSVAAGRAAAGA
jgi:hypothetical protein